MPSSICRAHLESSQLYHRKEGKTERKIKGPPLFGTKWRQWLWDCSSVSRTWLYKYIPQKASIYWVYRQCRVKSATQNGDYWECMSKRDVHLPCLSGPQSRWCTTSEALRMRRSTNVARRRTVGVHNWRYSLDDNLNTHHHTGHITAPT